MKKRMILLSLLGLLQACTSSPKIPVCEPNDKTQHEYVASSNNLVMRAPTLRAFTDFDAGIACAQRQNKPVFLGFTGYGARTRFFPDIVFLNPIIFNYLLNDFVPIILYVDDRQKLPSGQVEDIVNEDGTTTRIRNYGDRNAHLQKTMFQRESQPYLVWMTWQGELLTDPLPYRPDVNDYIEAFHAASKAFKKKK